jgi:hypothetical protein
MMIKQSEVLRVNEEEEIMIQEILFRTLHIYSTIIVLLNIIVAVKVFAAVTLIHVLYRTVGTTT